MEIPKNRKADELKKFNIKTDVMKSGDVLGNEIIKVHDFFGKSTKVDKTSDIFPRSNNNGDILS